MDAPNPAGPGTGRHRVVAEGTSPTASPGLRARLGRLADQPPRFVRWAMLGAALTVLVTVPVLNLPADGHPGTSQSTTLGNGDPEEPSSVTQQLAATSVPAFGAVPVPTIGDPAAGVPSAAPDPVAGATAAPGDVAAAPLAGEAGSGAGGPRTSGTSGTSNSGSSGSAGSGSTGSRTSGASGASGGTSGGPAGAAAQQAPAIGGSTSQGTTSDGAAGAPQAAAAAPAPPAAAAPAPQPAPTTTAAPTPTCVLGKVLDELLGVCVPIKVP